MKNFYSIVLSILLLIMIANIVYVWKKHTRYEKKIIRLLGAAIFTSIFYILFLNSKRMGFALLWDGIYFWMCDVLCYFMLKFVEEYTEVFESKPRLDCVLLALTGLDGIGLLINNKTHHLFVLQEKVYAGRFSYFTENFRPIFYTHLLLCYVMVGLCFALLIYKYRHDSIVYRKNYLWIIVPFMILVVVNAFCYTYGFPIDGSVAMYAIVTLVITLCVYTIVPNRIIEHVRSYVMEHVPSGIICFDHSNQCIYMNQILQKLIQEKNGITKQAVQAFFLSKKEEFMKNDVGIGEWEEDITINDCEYILRIRYQLIHDQNKEYQGCFFIAENRTDEVQQEREKKYRFDYDVLTGLYNERKFVEKANQIIQSDPKRKKWLIVSDIKNFKMINNIYGSDFGDEVLKKQAELVKQYSDKDTICARISGDKFAMLSFSEEFSRKKFEYAVHELEKYTMSKKYRICYHIGLYDITGLEQPIEKLYNLVNLAISTIHDDYDKIFVECNQEILDQIVHENEIINEFDNALQERQFVMYLQPQVSIDGTAVGAEALVRWHHPEKGLIFPDQFIGVLERAGIIHKMDLSIWEQAGEKLAEWKNAGEEEKYISVNISTKDFYYMNVFDELVKIVEKYQINPYNLKLEITESALMLDQDTGFTIISKLRDYGFEVEIDDFGSGFSSLNMLKEINVDVLKIDRIFLKETADREKSKIILESVISMAKKMGMLVVTEGVENEGQVVSLTEMGSDVFQGYYFDKPMKVEQFENKYI